MSISPDQRRAIKTEEAARVLVIDLNERIKQQDIEIEGLRQNYADIQDKHAEMTIKYHDADTLSQVLESKGQTLAVIEFIKVVISGVLLGWGFLLLGKNDSAGTWLIGGAIIVYVIALVLQGSIATRKDRKRVK